MKVSILITTYNLESYIAATLESVLAQETDFPFEILVGDDGSTDQTMAILEEYQKKYPEKLRLFQMPRSEQAVYNKVERAAANRLQLWKEAKGAYVSFLDGDDFYTSTERLAKMVRLLEAPENQDCSMCAHNLSMYYSDEKQFPLCSRRREQKLGLSQYWPLTFLQANALLVRNNYAQLHPEGAVAANFDDNNITYWFFQFGKMYYLPEILGAYRQLEDSSWNSNDELKKNCSNMIGYSIERLLQPQKSWASAARHYKELNKLLRVKNLSPEACSPFYETAKAYDLQWALTIYHYQEADAKTKCRVRHELRRGALAYALARAKRVLQKLLKRY